MFGVLCGTTPVSTVAPGRFARKGATAAVTGIGTNQGRSFPSQDTTVGEVRDCRRWWFIHSPREYCKYMGVSENSGTPKSSILGCPYFWKHPYVSITLMLESRVYDVLLLYFLVVRSWVGPQSCFRCYCLPGGYCLACSFSWTRSASCCVLLAGLLCLPCWLFPYFLGLSVSGPSSGLPSWFCPPPVPRSFWVGLWWGCGPGCYRSVLALVCPRSLVGLPFLWASSWPLFLSLSWPCLRVPSNVRF